MLSRLHGSRFDLAKSFCDCRFRPFGALLDDDQSSDVNVHDYV
jgi:hypothetical protein